MTAYIPNNLALPKRSYYYEIDFLKAIAIIFILIAHAIASYLWLYPFHVIQAIPIFMIVAGFTASLQTSKLKNISSYYSLAFFRKTFNRIILPFLLITILSCVIKVLAYSETIKQCFIGVLKKGGVGPGSYFPVMFIQHLLFFPLLYRFSLVSKIDEYAKIFIVLFISICCEYGCIYFKIPLWLYRMLFVRYIFVVYLGILLYRMPKFRASFFIPLSILSAIYIGAECYWGSVFTTIIYPAWQSHHAPAYFYSFIIVVLLGYIANITRSKIVFVEKYINIIGQASYHIFIVQMPYFYFIQNKMLKSLFPLSGTYKGLVNCAIIATAGVLFPLAAGVLFFRIQKLALKKQKMY